MEKLVLIFAHPQDIHARSVKVAIEEYSDNVCLIVDLSSSELRYSVCPAGKCFGEIHEHGMRIDLSQVVAVWCRRVQFPKTFEQLSAPEDRFISRMDSRQGLEGMLLSLERRGVRFVNPRRFENAALNKVFQLEVAGRMGLKIPKTLISNESEHVRNFADALWSEGLQASYKGFQSPPTSLIPNRILEKADFEDLDLLSLSPAIFQEYITGRDIRVTAVGEEVFAAEVKIQMTEAKVDWRLQGGSELVACFLPDELRAKISAYMKEVGLLYGAFDFKLTDSGDFVFLEVNPGGQFLFVEIHTGLPISKAMAKLLCSPTNTN